MICEKCGTNFAVYWELVFERSVEEADRLSWDRFKSAVALYFQVLSLPFTSVGGLLRSLIIRMISARLSTR
jgi:hypothetical protein